MKEPNWPPLHENDIYSVSLRIQSECVKNTAQKNFKYGHFSRSAP